MDNIEAVTFEESRKKIKAIVLVIGFFLLFLSFFIIELVDYMFYTSVAQIMITSFLVSVIYIAFAVIFIFEIAFLIKFIKPCKIIFRKNYMYATKLNTPIAIADIKQVEAIPQKSIFKIKNIKFSKKLAIIVKLIAGIGSKIESGSDINIDNLPELSGIDHLGVIVIKDTHGNIYFLPLDLELSQYTIEDIRREIFH